MNRHILSLIAALSLTAVSHAATTEWTGSLDNDFNTADNWTAGVPDADGNDGLIASGTPIIDLNFDVILTQNDGDVVVDRGGSLVRFSVGTWTMNGGSFDVATGDLRFNGGDFILNAGELRYSGAPETEAYRIENADSSFHILSGNHNLGGGKLGLRNGQVLIDNASLTVGSFNFAINGTGIDPQLTVRNGATLTITSDGNSSGVMNYVASNNTGFGQVTFDGAASAITADTWNSGRRTEWNIDFTSAAVGSTFTINSSERLTEAQWQTQWTNGKLTVDGGNAGSFADHFEVTTTDNSGTLTFIPEPAAVGMLGAAGALLILRRR